ncbi:MAG TPA: hypothetical protein VJP85_00930 [Candidatus Baltobacteraceae bacterium]|nr:hypothetical protein [Candidatus Baltobacteraceae bacterium]
MFDSLKGMVEQAASGNVDPQALGQAASDHVANCDPGELQDHLQTAASNLQQNGQGDLAQQASSLISQLQSNPSGAKDAVVSFIQNNPQVLQHFAPGFAQGILSKIGL